MGPDSDLEFLGGDWDATRFAVQSKANPEVAPDLIGGLGSQFFMNVQPSGQYTAMLVFPMTPVIETGLLEVDGNDITFHVNIPCPATTRSRYTIFAGGITLEGDTELAFIPGGGPETAFATTDLKEQRCSTWNTLGYPAALPAEPDTQGRSVVHTTVLSVLRHSLAAKPPHLHNEVLEIRRRHTGDATRLAEGVWADAAEFLPSLFAQAPEPRVRQVSREGKRLLFPQPIGALTLALHVAFIAKLHFHGGERLTLFCWIERSTSRLR